MVMADRQQSILWLSEALTFEAMGDHGSAMVRVARLLVLGPPPADALLAEFGRMLTHDDPGVVAGLANLLLRRGFRWEAGLLFARHLSLAPDVAYHEGMFDMLDRLSAEHLLDLAIAQQEVKQQVMMDRLLRRALAHDPGPERPQPPPPGSDLLSTEAIASILQQVRHPSTVYCLHALCRLRNANEAAALCEVWLRPCRAIIQPVVRDRLA